MSNSIRERAPIEAILRPFQWFTGFQAGSGILLMLSMITALIWANSPWSESYHHFWHIPISIGFGDFALNYSLLHWINDGLMAVFFFVVGLEIKRELMVGELASFKRAALPMAGALGGMVLPALIYAGLNRGGAGSAGWGIPMATDIAFAIGVITLLGKRVPIGLKVFLTALAIGDDLGAVMVIAVFYTADISWVSLGWGGFFLVGLVLLNLLGVRRPMIYALVGLCLWLCFLKSGVHATVAGVLLAFTIPSSRRVDSRKFSLESRGLLDEFDRATKEEDSILKSEGQQSAVAALEHACENVQAPMQKIEHRLLPWVNYMIMPVFALSNAGVTFTGNPLLLLKEPISLGVLLGLLLGKPIGITLFSWIAVRTRMADLPATVSWNQVVGAGFLGGIGFTMSLFISSLAFADQLLLDESKVGIFTGSILAGAIGATYLMLSTKKKA